TIDSDTLAAVLQAVAGSDSLVDRNGRAVPVSLVPFQLEARLVRGEGAGISVEVRCRQQVASSDATPDVRERSFHLAEVYVLPSVLAWIQIETGELAPLVAGGPGLWIERLQEDDLSELKADDLDRFRREGAELLRRMCLGRLETEAGLIREVEGV